LWVDYFTEAIGLKPLHCGRWRREASAAEREQLHQPDGPHHQVLRRAEVIVA